MVVYKKEKIIPKNLVIYKNSELAKKKVAKYATWVRCTEKYDYQEYCKIRSYKPELRWYLTL